MAAPPLEVADLVRAAGPAFIEHSRRWLTWLHLKVLTAIERCRTAALGGHVDECTRCGHRAISYNSCRNRHCPKCQANARDRWLEARRRELLPTRYVHVVFTLPHELAAAGSAKQEDHLRSAVPDQRRDTAYDCSRSQASWGRDWILQRAAYLESEARAPSARALRRSSRRIGARSHTLDPSTVLVLPSSRGLEPSLPRQVRGWPAQGSGCGQTRFPWNSEAARTTEGVLVVPAAVLSARTGLSTQSVPSADRNTLSATSAATRTGSASPTTGSFRLPATRSLSAGATRHTRTRSVS